MKTGKREPTTVDDFGEDIEGPAAGFSSAASVIGDDDAVGSIFSGEEGVLSGFQTLDNDLHPGDFLQAADVRPIGIGRVVLAG